MSWQPIETAPKDGTPVLIYRDGEIGVAMFRHPFLETVEQGEWLGLTIKDPSGRVSCARIEARWPGDDTIVVEGTPTHWMPLPEPPEAQK